MHTLEPVTLPDPTTDRAAAALWARVAGAPQAPAVAPGDRCVSVRLVPGRYCYHAPAVYEARARQADGALTWRCVDPAPLRYIDWRGRRYPVAFRSLRKARRAAAELAKRMCVPVLTVRHGGEA